MTLYFSLLLFIIFITSIGFPLNVAMKYDFITFSFFLSNTAKTCNLTNKKLKVSFPVLELIPRTIWLIDIDHFKYDCMKSNSISFSGLKKELERPRCFKYKNHASNVYQLDKILSKDRISSKNDPQHEIKFASASNYWSLHEGNWQVFGACSLK